MSDKEKAALNLMIESVLKPDSKLRGCVYNQGCYEELMSQRGRILDNFIVMKKVIRMKFRLKYDKPKKKGHWSRQEATFYDMNDLLWYKDIILESGCKNYTITPVD